jgi:hypothetical protein
MHTRLRLLYGESVHLGEMGAEGMERVMGFSTMSYTPLAWVPCARRVRNDGFRSTTSIHSPYRSSGAACVVPTQHLQISQSQKIVPIIRMRSGILEALEVSSLFLPRSCIKRTDQPATTPTRGRVLPCARTCRRSRPHRP